MICQLIPLKKKTLFCLISGQTVTSSFFIDAIRNKLQYPALQNYTVLFLQETKDVLYLGGTDFVQKIDVDRNNVMEVGIIHYFVLLIVSFFKH